MELLCIQSQEHPKLPQGELKAVMLMLAVGTATVDRTIGRYREMCVRGMYRHDMFTRITRLNRQKRKHERNKNLLIKNSGIVRIMKSNHLIDIRLAGRKSGIDCNRHMIPPS